MEKYIQKWLESGYISQEQSNVLLEDVKCEKKKNQQTATNMTFYTIGAILIGIGIMTCATANDWVLKLFYSRFAKIITALVATFTCLGAGYYFAFVKKNLAKLGDVLIFLSTILIGGTYVLISRIYGIDIDTAPGNTIYLIWSLSILPFAFMFKKQSINILALALFIFYILFSNLFNAFQVLLPVAFGMLMYAVANLPVIKKNYPDFSLAYKITAIFPLFFTVMYISTGETVFYGAKVICPITFVVLLGFILLDFFINKEKSAFLKIETLVLSLLALFAIRLNLTHTIIPTIIWADVLIANLLIIITIACLYNFGYKLQNKELAENANLFLLIYITVLYYRLGYSFLDKALFFFIGGLGLLVAGIYIERQKRVLSKTSGDENNEQN